MSTWRHRRAVRRILNAHPYDECNCGHVYGGRDHVCIRCRILGIERPWPSS